MKNLAVGILVMMTILFTGCFDVLEELYIDKNGKGQYTITMDASGLMKDGGLRTLMQSMGGEEMGENNPFTSGDAIEVDTIINMASSPDSLKRNFKHPELLSRMSMRQEISEEAEKMKTTFVFDFNNISEINLFLEDMGNMSQGGGAEGLGALGMGPAGMVGTPDNGAPLFSIGKKLLTRAKVTPAEEGALDDESMAMMKMMLADATYTTIYNLPGRVKKTTIPDAVVDGKQVKIKYDILDIIDGKADQSGTIKFAKK